MLHALVLRQGHECFELFGAPAAPDLCMPLLPLLTRCLLHGLQLAQERRLRRTVPLLLVLHFGGLGHKALGAALKRARKARQGRQAGKQGGAARGCEQAVTWASSDVGKKGGAARGCGPPEGTQESRHAHA